MAEHDDADAGAIARALDAVRARVIAAAREAGRDDGSVRLIAVSKKQPIAALRAAYDAGQRDFGENYPQELAEKAAALAGLEGLRLHLIGNLQSNKAKVAARDAALVHTVDDVHVARELGRRAASLARVLPVLVQVNVAAEPQKHGCSTADLGELLDAVEREPALHLSGLMTVPPLSEGVAGARSVYATLRTLRSLHGGQRRLPELSMGMSNDFEAAVAEGATLVRVGTAIFGARD